MSDLESQSKKECTLRMQDPVGFHTRTAAMFARQAVLFGSSIQVLFGDKKAVNGKSMLGLMSLGVKGGDDIRIIAEGGDAGEALSALRNLIENGFFQQP